MNLLKSIKVDNNTLENSMVKAPIDEATMYGGQDQGYIDYPFLNL